MSAKKKAAKKESGEKTPKKKRGKLHPAVRAYRQERRKRERRGWVPAHGNPCGCINGQKLLQFMEEHASGAGVWVYVGGRKGVH
jgi:hypothetical protein